MIQFVTAKFQTDNDLLSNYAEKFQFIMIDEFQDTNNSQNNVIDLILSVGTTPPASLPPQSREIQGEFSQNIMVVWDDDQSIYRFQWANIENMLDFVSKYPSTKMIVLDNNYRSSQDILDISQNLITNNIQRITNRISSINKNLKAFWEDKDLKQNWFFMLENDIKEKLFVYNEIKKYNNPNSTFAIIVKTNKQVEEWSLFLKQKWLLVNSKNNTNILNNPYCNFLLDFLKIIENPYINDESFLTLLRNDLIQVENIDAIYISRNLYQKNYSRQRFKLWIWDIIKDISSPHPSPLPMGEGTINMFKNIEKIITFRDFILSLNSSLWNGWITALIRDVLEKINIFEYIEKNWNFNDLQDIFTLVNKIKSYIENDKDITLKIILNKFDLYKKFSLPILRENIIAINTNIEILTAHSSKWLEYDYVFIPWVYEWNWNQKRQSDKLKLPIWITWNWLQYADIDEKEHKELEKEIALEEERRLFFVAMTRAKKSLIFTLPKTKENKLLLQSSFILETWLEPQNIELDISENEMKEILISSMLETHLVKTTKDEIDYIENFLQNYKLSPTDLNKFIEDPKRFLREVIFKYPFLSNENLIFGTVYHKVLEIVTVKKKNGILLWKDEFTKLFLDEIKKYDLTKEEYDRVYERWINWLQWYYDIFISNKREVIATEFNFSSKGVIFQWIPLTWKIDKIELTSHLSSLLQENGNSLTPSGEGVRGWEQQLVFFKEEIALVDYKTWNIKRIWEIKWIDRNWEKKDGEWNYLRQLLFYKLMVENCFELDNKFKVWELALDFVEWKKWEYNYVRVDYNFEDYEHFKNELLEARWKISNIDFWKEILK